jgi:hypothetical protein
MVFIVRRYYICAVFLSVLLCASDLVAQQVEERFATVRGLIGTAEVRFSQESGKVRRERAVARSSAGGSAIEGVTAEWTPLRLNMVVGERCEIRTGPQSEVRFETTEGSMIRIGENTVIEIAAMRAETRRTRGRQETSGSTTVRLREGDLIANIRKLLNETPNVRFETPTLTAAIRGTTVEIEARRGASTLIRAFDGVVHVAPAGTNRFVQLKDGEMVEVAPRQRAVVVRRVPTGYQRRGVFLRNEAEPVEESRGVADAEAEPLVLTLDLSEAAEVVDCYAGDTLTVAGRVSPPTARVSVNGLEAAPDSTGAFNLTFAAPADSGAFALHIIAENDTLTETVIQVVNVRHVHTTVALTSPEEGQVVDKPLLTVSGTAAPGSRVNVLGVTLNVRRDGTFSGEVPLPDEEGEVRVQVEIVDREHNAVWIERNIKYRK